MKSQLRQFAFQILELSSQMLSQDEALAPVAFIITEDDHHLAPLAFSNEEEKASAYAALVEAAKELGAIAILTINDVRRWDATDPRIRAALNRGEKPDAGLATESIFLTLSGPSVTPWSLERRYSRTAKGIEFGDTREESEIAIDFLPGWAEKKPLIN